MPLFKCMCVGQASVCMCVCVCVYVCVCVSLCVSVYYHSEYIGRKFRIEGLELDIREHVEIREI